MSRRRRRRSSSISSSDSSADADDASLASSISDVSHRGRQAARKFKELSLTRLVLRPAPRSEAEVQEFIERLMEPHNLETSALIADVWQSPQGFKLSIWTRQSIGSDPLAQEVSRLTGGECVLQSASYQSLLFFYRNVATVGASADWEVFVLLAGHGTHAILSAAADYVFPIQVAKRLLEPAFRHTDAQHIGGGNLLASKDHYKQGHTTWIKQLDWIRSCECRLRHDSSLRAYPPFLVAPSEQPKEFSITVNAASVRIKTSKILFAMWPELLHHLSLVARGCPTSCLQPLATGSASPAAELDSTFFDVLNQVQFVVDKQLCKRLLAELMTQCASAIAEGDASLFPFDFMHRHYEDYLSSDNVVIGKDGESNYNFGSAPSRQQVITWLHGQQTLQQAACNALNRPSDSEEASVLHKELDRVRVSFTKRGSGDEVRVKLTAFICGSLFLDGKAFFRLGGLWYVVSEPYLLNADKQYVECMHRCAVVDVNDGAYVDLTWSSTPVPQAVPAGQGATGKDMTEHNYNLRYYGRRVPPPVATGRETLFVYGDESFLHLRDKKGDLELWDFLKITETDTYVVQVKIGFASSLRAACSQIRNAADLLCAHDGPTTAARWLEQALAAALPAGQPAVQPIGVNPADFRSHCAMLQYYAGHREEWHSLFHPSRLTFVLAFHDEGTSLDVQKRMQVALPIDFFANEHEIKDRRHSIPHSQLLSELQGTNPPFLNDKGQPTMALRAATTDSFKTRVPCLANNQTAATRCLKMLQDLFFSSCKSMVSQLELVHLHQHLGTLHCRGLRIVQIPH